MVKQRRLEQYDPFSAKPEEIKGLVQNIVRELGFPALTHVSAAARVPASELSKCYRGQDLPLNYLPVLYIHFFGNVSPDKAKQYRTEHEL